MSVEELLDGIYIPDPTDPTHEREITLYDISKHDENISLAEKIIERATALIEAERIAGGMDVLDDLDTNWHAHTVSWAVKHIRKELKAKARLAELEGEK